MLALRGESGARAGEDDSGEETCGVYCIHCRDVCTGVEGMANILRYLGVVVWSLDVERSERQLIKLNALKLRRDTRLVIAYPW